MTNKEEVIKKLKQAMLESGLTQTELAKKLGLTQSAIQKWLSGKNSPKLSVLEKLSEVTSKPINYFFENSPVGNGNNVTNGNNNQFGAKENLDLKKEIELLKAKQEVQELKIENLQMRLNHLEHKK